jgi:hypothetical protein
VLLLFFARSRRYASPFDGSEGSIYHQTIAREQRQGATALKSRMRMMVSAKNNKSEKPGSAL